LRGDIFKEAIVKEATVRLIPVTTYFIHGTALPFTSCSLRKQLAAEYKVMQVLTDWLKWESTARLHWLKLGQAFLLAARGAESRLPVICKGIVKSSERGA
jgi:hypothetical protein